MKVPSGKRRKKKKQTERQTESTNQLFKCGLLHCRPDRVPLSLPPLLFLPHSPLSHVLTEKITAVITPTKDRFPPRAYDPEPQTTPCCSDRCQ